MSATTYTLKKKMLLSTEEYAILRTTGTLTKDGVTYTYAPQEVEYVTPDAYVLKPTKITITDNSEITLGDNCEYYGTDLTTLTVNYPQGDFESELFFTTASSGTITISFPTDAFIGVFPSFSNNESWEVNVKNGILIARKVDSGA